MSYFPNNPNGQATSANSAPVVIASDQSAVNVLANLSANTGIPSSMIKIVQKTNNVSSGTVTNLAKAFTSNNTVGNSIVVVCAVGNTSTMSVFDSNGNTYATAASRAGAAFGTAIFYATNILAGSNTVTVSNTGVSDSMAMEIYEVLGLIEMNPAAFDQSGVNSGTGTTLSGAAFTPTTANTYAFAGLAVGTAAQTITVTAGSVGWANDSGQLNPTSPSGLFSFVSASAFLPTLSAVVVGAGIGSSEPWAVVSANFKPIALNIGGTVNIGNSVVIASNTSTLTAQGARTNNAGATGTNNFGTLPAIAATAVPAWTSGNQVALSTFLNGAVMTDATSVNGTAVVTGGVAGSTSVGGPTASGVAVAANPLTGGGKAVTALPTAVSTGQVVNDMRDIFGRTVTMPYGPRGVIGASTTTITSSTSATTVIAAVASQFSDIVAIIFDNSSATATHVTLSDGTASYNFDVPAGDIRGLTTGVILPATTANVAWTVTCGTSVASLYVTTIYVKDQ